MERKNDMVTDEELYGQYLCGDETGLELLIKKYGDPLTLYIDGYLHDVHEAEDLMMETFSWLFMKKPRIRNGCFKAYLYKAARHMALRHKSRRRIIFSLDNLTREAEAQTLVEEVVRTKERNQILHLCMDELNPDYREALYLTYFEGMSYQQAAEVMGKSVKQITNMVYRGKERLRGLLKREVLQMLKDEERIAEVKRRIAKKEQQQRLRRRRIISAVCIAACFAVIVGVSFAMPGIVGQIEPGTSSGFETAATILGGSTALGYMVIGLLAFILGVCVTVLCFRIRQLNKEEQTEMKKEDNGDGTVQ